LPFHVAPVALTWLRHVGDVDPGHVIFFFATFNPVPPQNPVDLTIVDVSAIGIKLPYPMLHLLYALFATAGSKRRAMWLGYGTLFR